MREFAQHVTGEDLTEKAVGNAKRQADNNLGSLEQGTPKGSAKKQQKGRERANNTGGLSRDSDSSYRDEVRWKKNKIEKIS